MDHRMVKLIVFALIVALAAVIVFPRAPVVSAGPSG